MSKPWYIPLKRLCVLIPAKDEAINIGATIRSILSAQVLPADIYVIDDGSKDTTAAIARSFLVNVLRIEKNGGKANAIHRACQDFQLLKRYNIIALMDADTMVNSHYFTEVKKGFADKNVAVVCGRPKSVPYNWLTAYRSFVYFLTHFVYRDAQSNMGVINVAPGCAASYRSDVFAQLDWSHDTLVEDMDVTIQVHRKKLGRLIYRPKAEVYTQDPRTLRDYAKQMNRWYTGTWQVGFKHHIFTGWTKLDLEWKLLMGEGLLFATMIALIPLWLCLWPRFVLGGMAFDAFIMSVISILCGLLDWRKDVILASPLYVVVRFIDCAVLLSSFWNTVVLRRNQKTWFSVQRY